MADQDPNSGGNGSAAPEGGAQFSVLGQYIKDLSVENPSSPQVFQWQVQPGLDVQFNINVDKVADEVHEVTLKVEVTARSDQGVHFVVDLSYAGLFGIRGLPEEAMGPILLVEAPRLLFPFARQIIADAITNTGFPPLLLDPIDFASAYVAQVEAAQRQSEQDGGNGSGQPAPTETPSEA